MLFIVQTALELGVMYALVSMALYLSYRILDIADLTTDGTFRAGTWLYPFPWPLPGIQFWPFRQPWLPEPEPVLSPRFLQTRLGVPSILAGNHYQYRTVYHQSDGHGLVNPMSACSDRRRCSPCSGQPESAAAGTNWCWPGQITVLGRGCC